MKQPTFTENELSLIGECVLQTMNDLRATSGHIWWLSEAVQSIETTLGRCQTILEKLAEACHE